MENIQGINLQQLHHDYVEAQIDRSKRKLKGGAIRGAETRDCAKKLKLHYDAVPPTDEQDLPDSTLLLFAEGNEHEDSIIESFKKAGYPVVDEQKWVEPIIAGIKVRGRMDFRIRGVGIVEVKTVESFNHTPLPKQSAVNQIQLYMHSEGEKVGILFYKARSNGAVKLFKVNLPDSAIDVVTANLKRVHDADTHEDIAPKRVTECKWCRYRTLCWSG